MKTVIAILLVASSLAILGAQASSIVISGFSDAACQTNLGLTLETSTTCVDIGLLTSDYVKIADSSSANSVSVALCGSSNDCSTCGTAVNAPYNTCTKVDTVYVSASVPTGQGIMYLVYSDQTCSSQSGSYSISSSCTSVSGNGETLYFKGGVLKSSTGGASSSGFIGITCDATCSNCLYYNATLNDCVQLDSSTSYKITAAAWAVVPSVLVIAIAAILAVFASRF